MRTIFLLIFLFIALSGRFARCDCQETTFAPQALPSARSSYVLFNHFLSLPPFSAEQPAEGTWILDPSIVLSNILTGALVDDKGTTTITTYIDYESLAFELPVQVGIGGGWSLGADVQASYIWGGFLDTIINSFHLAFGFPDNGRNQLPSNRVLVNVDTNNGIAFHADAPVFAVSDPVFTVGYQFVHQANVRMSFRAALSVPIGLGDGLVGAKLPGLGLGSYLDWEPLPWMHIDGLIGGLLPGEMYLADGPYPMLVMRLSIVLDPPGWDIVPFLDFNLHTSPFTSQLILKNGVDFFAQPNADLLFGVLIPIHEPTKKSDYWAFTVQEDPFVHNTADVSFQANAAITLP